jgi:hypothetical protein
MENKKISFSLYQKRVIINSMAKLVEIRLFGILIYRYNNITTD